MKTKGSVFKKRSITMPETFQLQRTFELSFHYCFRLGEADVLTITSILFQTGQSGCANHHFIVVSGWSKRVC